MPPYADPSMGAVVGALEEGYSDPARVIDKIGRDWTPEQKARYSRIFAGHVDYLRTRSRQESERRQKELFEADVRGLQLQGAGPPIVRDIAGGVLQGGGDLGSLALRPFDDESRGSLSDTLNRKLEAEERAYQSAGAGDAVPDILQTGVRGASRSITTMVPLAATGGGAPVVIGGFAASRGNQAITEGRDAGLEGDQLAGYVGRAALIEGGVAGAFQAAGLGGAEKLVVGRTLTRSGAREILKQTGAELTEENVTELLDATNQSLSGVQGPLTETQALEIVKQTSVTTLLTMGALQGYNSVQARARRDEIASQLAATYGWTQPQAQGVVDRALARKGDFLANLGNEARDEGTLEPDALVPWVLQNEEAARALASKETPSRADFDAAGLPRRPAEVRSQVAAQVRELVEELDAARGPEEPSSPPAAPPEGPGAAVAPPSPTPPPAPALDDTAALRAEQDAERAALEASLGEDDQIVPPAMRGRVDELRARADAKMAREEFFLNARRRYELELLQVQPGSQDWRTADAETLRGLIEAFDPDKVSAADYQAARERLSVLDNPIPENADWRTASEEDLRKLIVAGAVFPDDREAALERQVELAQERMRAEEVAAAKRMGLKPPPPEEAPAAEATSEEEPLVQPTAEQVAIVGKAAESASRRSEEAGEPGAPSDKDPSEEFERREDFARGLALSRIPEKVKDYIWSYDGGETWGDARGGAWNPSQVVSNISEDLAGGYGVDVRWSPRLGPSTEFDSQGRVIGGGSLRVTKEQFEELLDQHELRLARSMEVEEPPPQPVPLPGPEEKGARTLKLSEAIEKEIRKIGGRLDWRGLKALADEAYGGTLAEHAYEQTDAYEALELAMNRAFAADASDEVGLGEARSRVGFLGEVLSRVPTQTTRSEEKIDLQQFSTPPNYAYAAVWVGAPRKGELVLEPSAGTGSLVGHAKASGARVLANELSDRRADLVATLADETMREDAEQLGNLFAKRPERPTLVVMNPPFSRAGERMKGKKLIHTGAKHVEAALEALAPGGRLVAIVGHGMSMDAPTFKAWWERIAGQYHVRANVGVSGDVYTKLGTSFPTRLLVIDKTLPETRSPIVTGDVGSAEDLLALLSEVRHDRPTAVPADRPAGGVGAASPGGPAGERVAPGGAAPVDPAARGGEPAGEGGVSVSPEGVRGEPTPGNERRRSGGVASGKRAPRGRSRARAGLVEGPAPGAAPPSTPGDTGVRAADRPDVEVVQVQAAEKVATEEGDTYEGYQAAIKVEGATEHPTPLVESAAMASVPAPKADYQPKLPAAALAKLSTAQLEPIMGAGAAHQQKLPMPAEEREVFTKLTGQEAPAEKRRGYFDGDGTGVGKGRIAAGIILDNFSQGRKRAIWVSENTRLLGSAVRDWTDLGGDKADVLGLHKVKAGERIGKPDGIVFATYDTLGTSEGQRAAEKKKSKEGYLTRVEQLATWFGSDYDGVIVFDEAHNAGNAVEMKGSRGKTKPSARALMMVELQRRLPNARVVYLSATGATQVSNLAYADRLGLWGEGTEFANREAFVSGVSAGGVAAMELVARDMKAQGMYVSRTLSFKGVGYDRLTHALDADQREVYDRLAEAWQVVLQNIHEALKVTSGEKDASGEGKIDPKQKRNALSAFWGAHQRFFNQVLTSLQMPSVLKALEADLAAGRAPVIQLVNTLEASTERALAQVSEEEGDLEDLDLTPKDMLIQMVEKSFPVTQLEGYTDENGNTRYRPVVDSKGDPVENARAVELRDALLDDLRTIRVPDAPIDQIINRFGAKNVAEVTGRKRRVTMVDGKREIQNRTKAMTLEDVRAFQDDEKKILIFSQAGATGASYHADNTKKNKRQREHYVLQAGWRADQAIQGLGRSHRSNQAQPPRFRLVETDLPGHRRFISTIAKRLEQLGALSRGQRTAGGGGLFSERDNLEGTHAQDALTHLLRDIVAGRAEGIEAQDFEQQTGLELRDENGSASPQGIRVAQFLNRLLSLKIDMQNRVFDAYSERLDAAIEYARQNGTLDVGMETIKATKIEKISERVIRKDERTGAATSYVALRVLNPPTKIAFEDVADYEEAGFYRNRQSELVYVIKPAGTVTEASGKIVDLYHRYGPRGGQVLKDEEFAGRYDRIPREVAQKEWNDVLASMPELEEDTIHMVTGALLPVWNRLGKSHPRIRRVTTDKGERFLGRLIADDDLEAVLANLGLAHKTETPSAEQAQEILKAGGRIEFANGWTIKATRVRDELAFELTGSFSLADGRLLVDMGARKTPVGSKNRYFLPRGEGFAAPWARFTKSYEVARVVKGTEDRRMYAPDDPPDGPPPGGGGLRVLSGGRGGSGEPIQKVEVIRTIERLWPGLSIRGPATFKRQFKTARAMGWYVPGLGEMRLRDAYDVVTAIHELGHHFDREMGNWSKQRGLPDGIPAELTQLGRDLYGDRKPEGGYRSEGFAEFIREYLMRSGDLQSRAPKLYRWWTSEYLQENPEEAEKLHELQGRVVQLLTQTPQQAIEALLRPTRKDWSAERVAADLAGMRDYKFRDANLALLHAMQATGDERLDQLRPTEHPYQLATFFARTAGGRTRHAAMTATTDLWGRENGKGLRQVLDRIVAEGDQNLKEWIEYAVAKRSLLLRERKPGYEPGLEESHAEALVSEREGRPGYLQAMEEFTDFAHRALGVLVEAGYMTEEEFEAVEEQNPLYVPFLRRMESDRARSGVAGRGKAVNKLTQKGSNLPLHDPIDAMLLQYEKIQKVAMQHAVARSVVRYYDSRKGKVDFLGQFLSEEPRPVERVRFSAEQIRSQVLSAVEEEDAESVAEALEALWDQELTVWRPGTKPKDGRPVMSIVIDGRRRNFEIQPALLPILEGVAESTFLGGTLGMVSREATRLQRLGATGLNPAFSLFRNVIRDTLTAFVTADYHFHVPLVSTVVGTWKYLAEGDVDSPGRRYDAAGLPIAGEVGQDLSAARGLRAQLTATSRLQRFTRAPIAGIREFFSMFEAGPRVLEFSAAYDAGMARYGNSADATVLAGNASKDVTVNFSRAGSWSRKANEVTLFFNAAVQSADKASRAFGLAEPAPWASTQSKSETLARSAKRVSALTAAAILLYAMNGDEEWWKELPPHEKWAFLHMKIGDTVVRIPLPFEIGSVFGALPVAMLEGPKAFREAFGVAAQNSLPVELHSLHALFRNVAFLAPAADVLSNKDWKDSPIVPETFEDNRVPSDQYGPRTTGLARLLGASMPWDGGSSPARIEHLLDNYTGGLYRRLAGAIDTLLDPSRISSDDLSTVPVAGTLFLRPGTSRLTGEFYDRLKVLRQRSGSKLASLEEAGELAAAERLNRELQGVWQQRRAAMASGASAGKIAEEVDKLHAQVNEKIRAHNARNKAEDRAAGLGAVLYRATDPSASAELPRLDGVPEREAVEALRAEAARRARARGQQPDLRARDDSGNWTAFGKRQARLLKALRSR